jgi:hypothetical protein
MRYSRTRAARGGRIENQEFSAKQPAPGATCRFSPVHCNSRAFDVEPVVADAQPVTRNEFDDLDSPAVWGAVAVGHVHHLAAGQHSLCHRADVGQHSGPPAVASGSERCQNPHVRCVILVAFAAMSRDADPLAERHAAYTALRKWAKVHAERDEVIRAAVAAGIDTRSIKEITGVARTTITRITAGDRVRQHGAGGAAAGPAGKVKGLVEVGAAWLGEGARSEGDPFAVVAWDDGVKRAPVPVAGLVKDECQAAQEQGAPRQP